MPAVCVHAPWLVRELKACRSTSLLGLGGIEGEGRRGKPNHSVCLGQFFLDFLEFLIMICLPVARGRT
jgi:hypothetical protein